MGHGPRLLPPGQPYRLVPTGAIEQGRAGVRRLEEEHIGDGSELAPVNEPSSNLECQIAK
jgi:hypothetical protein